MDGVTWPSMRQEPRGGKRGGVCRARGRTPQRRHTPLLYGRRPRPVNQMMSTQAVASLPLAYLSSSHTFPAVLHLSLSPSFCVTPSSYSPFTDRRLATSRSSTGIFCIFFHPLKFAITRCADGHHSSPRSKSGGEEIGLLKLY